MTGTSVYNYPGAVAYADIDTDDVGGKKVQRFRQRGPSTSTVVSVAYSTTNVTLLASNVNRLGATIYNGNTKDLFVKLGANATTVATLVLITGAYYEVPFGYTGIIDGLWAAGGNAGVASVTELLP